MQVVLDEENTSQEQQLQASEISHLNLHDVCSLCAQVAPCLPLGGQTEEGWQEHILRAAQSPCQKAGAGHRCGWGGSGDNIV